MCVSLGVFINKMNVNHLGWVEGGEFVVERGAEGEATSM